MIVARSLLPDRPSRPPARRWAPTPTTSRSARAARSCAWRRAPGRPCWLVVLSGDGARATRRARARRPWSPADRLRLSLRDSARFLPWQGAEVKVPLAADRTARTRSRPRPRLEDAHQDHRLMAELTWQVFRPPICEYEIPKYEADLGRPNLYVGCPRSSPSARSLTSELHFPSQRGRTWFNPETFLGPLRIRGIEAGSPPDCRGVHLPEAPGLSRCASSSPAISATSARSSRRCWSTPATTWSAWTATCTRLHLRGSGGIPDVPAAARTCATWAGRRRGFRRGPAPRGAVQRSAGRPGPGADLRHQPSGVGPAGGARAGRRRALHLLVVVQQLRRGGRDSRRDGGLNPVTPYGYRRSSSSGTLPCWRRTLHARYSCATPRPTASRRACVSTSC